MSIWKEYDILSADVSTLLICLIEVEGVSEAVQNWLVYARSFVEIATPKGKDSSITL